MTGFSRALLKDNPLEPGTVLVEPVQIEPSIEAVACLKKRIISKEPKEDSKSGTGAKDEIKQVLAQP